MNRRNIIASVVTGVVAVTVAAGGFAFIKQQEQSRLDTEARTAADRFGGAWSQRDVKKIGYVGRSADQVATSFKDTTGGLGSAPVKVSVASLTRDGDKATGNLSVAWTIAEGTNWAYTMPISLQRASGETWNVVAKEGASMWAPGLDAKAKLVASRTRGKRGDILDRNRAPLVTDGKVYDVAIDPAIATPATVTALETITAEPVGSLVAKLNAAKASGSKAGIQVITYREADFQARRVRLDQLAGIVYPPRQAPLPPSREFARPLLGSYGPVTAEAITKGKGRYVAGDSAGLSGLQGQYDEVLSGGTGVRVIASDKPDAPLFEKPATPGAPMTLTLDTKTQKAAEAALVATRAVPSSLVAVDVVTGELLAVANSADNNFNRALQGRYPPGSTLKVATTYSLLSKGLPPSKIVPCPPSANVNGLPVRNYEGGALGKVPFSLDFANSCNTAFVGLAATMGNSDVRDAALALGIGAGWEKSLGIAGTFAGSVPASTSIQERALTALGQAKTEVSPAALAVMTASVARGTYIEPALIRTPAVPGADRAPKPLNAKALAQLRPLMRLVVTIGSGKTLRGVAGGPVFGKTGTAEYGTAKPFKTRAWVTGWQGTVAFAVLVEEGKSGGTVAAPIAKTFLQLLRR